MKSQITSVRLWFFFLREKGGGLLSVSDRLDEPHRLLGKYRLEGKGLMFASAEYTQARKERGPLTVTGCALPVRGHVTKDRGPVSGLILQRDVLGPVLRSYANVKTTKERTRRHIPKRWQHTYKFEALLYRWDAHQRETGSRIKTEGLFVAGYMKSTLRTGSAIGIPRCLS
ncbi:hypothetical protein B0F90DRAFT_324376 [Multifurca ochricompacta]|uniref:Uncharacterized protein n=1 Tax=Multifurca ochricompacta TaxID=376703 RepID=A0AAD4M4B3_9AGAM|nr:hypothetical protein B0F90DRAFT_324376 [Multifurca ochricompacta]